MNERSVTIMMNNQALMGIFHQGDDQGAQFQHDTAVLVIVGGPQYRVGSHRQFVQLARYLASQGVDTMRFDYRGMGDSEADKQPFDGICDDISAAISVLFQQSNQIKKVVIWGLCDAASAGLMYAYKDPRISGLVLLNPWLRSEQAMGKTMVKYYYLQRLLSKSFWKKLFSGKVNVAASARDAKGFVKDSVVENQQDLASYQIRMQTGVNAFEGKICLILSGTDLTAREFNEQTKKSKKWRVLRSNTNEIHHLPNADHTFSSSEFKREVEKITGSFIARCSS